MYKILVDNRISFFQLCYGLFLFLPIFSSSADFGPILITPYQLNEKKVGGFANSSNSFKQAVILDQDYINRSSARSVLDLLKGVVGIIAIDSTSGSPGSIFMRGFDSHHVVIKLDGFAINDPTTPNNRAVLEYLNINQIETIKIMQGTSLSSQSSFAGVIEITTKAAFQSEKIFKQKINQDKKVEKKLNTSVTIGSHHYQNTHFDLLLKKQSSIYAISAGKLKAVLPSARTDNNEKENQKNQFENFSYSKNLSDTKQLQLSLINNKNKLDYDNCFKQDFSNTNDCLSAFEKKSFALKLLAKSEPNEQLFTLNFQNLNRSLYSASIKVGQYKSTTKALQYKFKKKLKNHQNLKVGYDFRKDKISEIFSPINEKIVNQQSLFASLLTESNNHLFDLALRIESYQRDNQSDKKLNFESSYQYSFNPNFLVTTSYSKASRMPSVYQIFDSFAGNVNLKPEQVQYFEVGLLSNQEIINSPYIKNVQFDIRLFQSQISNYITYTTKYENLNSQLISKGLNLLIQSSIYTWQVAASYSHNPVYKENTNQRQLARRPLNSLSFSLSTQINRTHIGLNQRWQSKTYDLDTSQVQMPGFSLSDLSISHLILQNRIEQLKLNFRINNLFDKKVEQVKGYRTLDRSFFLSLDASF